MRTDIHRPSVIEPANYDFVAFEYIKIEDPISDAQFIQEQRASIQAHMARTGGTYSHHAHGGNCHICGAHAIYTALFYHKPSNAYVRTGLDCAESLECDSGAAEMFRRNVGSALERRAGKGKAQALLEAKGLGAAWAVYFSDDTHREESTVRDIVGKLVQYGSISEGQENYLRKLLDQIARRPEIEAQRAAETAAAAPVPTTQERLKIEGTVLSIKLADGQYVLTSRMLVRTKDGWKAWGSIPKAISEGLKVGDEVSFAAGISPSDKDPKFGFFRRPASAKVITRAA